MTPTAPRPTSRVHDTTATTQAPATAAPGRGPRESESARDVLDRAVGAMRDGQCPRAMTRLLVELNQLRAATSPPEWQGVVAACLEHPIRALLHEDPITRRAFGKPRGHAVDGALLDYFYDPPEAHLGAGISATGTSVYRFLHVSSYGRGVRERRRVIARAIDELAGRHARPRVLAIACGHARELELSEAFRAGRPMEFVGVDQDAEHLARVRARHGDARVRTVQSPLRDLLSGALAFESFDLVYSAGLYDYLRTGTATRLTQLLFRALAPGARLIVTNTQPSSPLRGYMESFMGMTPEFRALADVSALALAVPHEHRASTQLYADAHETFAYLELRRPG